VQKIIGNGHTFYLKFWPKPTNPFQKHRFPIDIRSYRLGRNTSEKSFINTNRKSTTALAFQWA